jgi:hypothetical protein
MQLDSIWWLYWGVSNNWIAIDMMVLVLIGWWHIKRSVAYLQPPIIHWFQYIRIWKKVWRVHEMIITTHHHHQINYRRHRNNNSIIRVNATNSYCKKFACNTIVLNRYRTSWTSWTIMQPLARIKIYRNLYK